VVLLVALVIGLLVPLPNVNPDTVAATLQAVNGGSALAECDRVRDDHQCRVDFTARPRASCGLPASARRLDVAGPAVAAAAQPCGSTASKATHYVADQVGDKLVAYATTGAAERAVTSPQRPSRSRPAVS
jgi:hypothetical protein